MINGDVKEFVDGLYYGDERWFLYHGARYFIQGWVKDREFTLVIDRIAPEPASNYPLWQDVQPMDKRRKAVENFLKAPLFCGKTFWEAEGEIVWVDDEIDDGCGNLWLKK